MSGIGWQDIVAVLLVLCALGYLVRRKLRPPKRRETLVKIGVGYRRAIDPDAAEHHIPRS